MGEDESIESYTKITREEKETQCGDEEVEEDLEDVLLTSEQWRQPIKQ